MTDTYDLRSLSQQADVTPRTIHYYIQQGLLPPADGSGRGARYAPGHLARLRLIRILQKEHLPLSEIRRRLTDLSDDDVERLLVSNETTPPPSSALEYVRAVMAGQSVGGRPSPTATAPASRPDPGTRESRLSTYGPDRSQWERVALTDDIEIHIRRPLARERNRQADKLLGLARDLFRGDEP